MERFPNGDVSAESVSHVFVGCVFFVTR